MSQNGERISEAEFAIMDVLWDHPGLSATQIAERVQNERGWSLQTVKTLLSRLVTKGAVTHEAEGRKFLYQPVLERTDYVSDESRRFVDKLFGGRAGPLFAHLAERDGFSEADIAEIEQLLKELKS